MWRNTERASLEKKPSMILLLCLHEESAVALA
jgi:hypothetical protein